MYVVVNVMSHKETQHQSTADISTTYGFIKEELDHHLKYTPYSLYKNKYRIVISQRIEPPTFNEIMRNPYVYVYN